MYLIICAIEDQYFAFNLSDVVRAALATETTPLPNAPDYILGALNLHDQIMPVVSLRQILGKSPKELDVQHHFLICRVKDQFVALWVDRVHQVRLYQEEELVPTKQIFPNLEEVSFILKEKGKMIFIYDLEKLLPKHAFALT